MTQLYIRPELPAYGPPEPYSFFDNLLNWALLLFLLKVGGCLIPWWVILAPVAFIFVALPVMLLVFSLFNSSK